MGVLVYGVEVEASLCGVWVFWLFHHVVLGWVVLVSLGLRYRLLWFGVFRCHRGVGMVRKWKCSLLANNRPPPPPPKLLA